MDNSGATICPKRGKKNRKELEASDKGLQTRLNDPVLLIIKRYYGGYRTIFPSSILFFILFVFYVLKIYFLIFLDYFNIFILKIILKK
jgi:hypothetical protein